MFDRIIVSCDDSEFVQYWFIVYKAWKKFYPNIKTTIGFITERKKTDPLILEMKKYYDDVVILKPVENVPIANQAKVARHYLATTYGDEICMVEDIDTIPLQKEFIDRITNARTKETLLAVGYEILENTEHHGKFPISNMTAESYIYKKFFNPENLSWEDLIKSFIDLKKFDHKEAINVNKNIFSDESLVRVLVNRWSPDFFNITRVRRDVDIFNYWIDRSWWRIDGTKLQSGQYVFCNFLRPFDLNFNYIEPIIYYIFNENLKINEVIKL